jgi:hypothetical protein
MAELELRKSFRQVSGPAWLSMAIVVVVIAHDRPTSLPAYVLFGLLVGFAFGYTVFIVRRTSIVVTKDDVIVSYELGAPLVIPRDRVDELHRTVNEWQVRSHDEAVAELRLIWNRREVRRLADHLGARVT